MLNKLLGLAIVVSGLAVVPVSGQAPVPAPQEPAGPAAPPQGQPPARAGGGGQKVGQTGNPDPGVNFLNVVENPHVRVLQVTLQPNAVRRPHVHNDVTFHMLVPVTGSLELTVEKEPVVTTVPGQAYYMMKGQTHTFTNKSKAPVQVIELFIKPDAAAGATPPTAVPATAAPPPAATQPAEVPK